MSFFSCYAQESVTVNNPTTKEFEAATVNLNNIKYVTLRSIGTVENDYNAIQSEGTEEFFKALSPSYLNVRLHGGNAATGWFISVQGGAAAFVGDPIGCDDLFGRVKPTLKVDVGKWINPVFGTRLQYQGFELKSGDLNQQRYDAAHVDFLWDLLSSNRYMDKEPRFALVPFLGCGIIRNRDADTHPFSLHYGLQGSVRLSNHFDLNLEIGCINTFKDFDGAGCQHQLGDQLLNASIGFSYKLRSKYSHRRVIDAVPYIEQNNVLLAALKQSRTEKRLLTDDLAKKDRILTEFKKILEIKGRLAKAFQDANIDRDSHSLGYPYNNYSGLNALRRRLSVAQDTSEPVYDDSIQSQPPSEDLNAAKTLSDISKDSCPPDFCNMDDDSYLALIRDNKVCIGAPILFFFELNSDKLTDKSQIANIKEIAQIVNDYNLKITVTGSADSATGNDSINQKLSSIRADYIIEEFTKLGVARANIKKEAIGGVSQYATNEANRNTCVRLFL